MHYRLDYPNDLQVTSTRNGCSHYTAEYCSSPCITRHDQDLVTANVRSIHWLQVHHPGTFKTTVLLWKWVHGAASAYLPELCIHVENVGS